MPSRQTVPTSRAPVGLPDPGALVRVSRAYDTRGLEDILDAAFTGAGFEHVVDVWLMQAMAELGVAWANGDLDVSQEHFVSAGVLRRLSAAFDAAGHARGGRHVVTGLAPGATHEIATLAFSTILRRVGLRVTYLGPDLPVASWVQAVVTTHPDAVVIGAPRLEDTPAAEQVVSALREAAPQLAIYVGGAGATHEESLQGETLAKAADWLADSLVPA
ncbi:MAG TPA: cobalamin-dependent protein [Propionibacteriaceae bacterium]|nr:cobalamin-dependent protein [Propionibacteriaceae bacterium]